MGNNNIMMDLKNDIEKAPVFTYSSKLLQEVIDNTNKKIIDKKINLIDDYMAIFPLSVTLTLFIVILILIYISFF